MLWLSNSLSSAQCCPAVSCSTANSATQTISIIPVVAKSENGFLVTNATQRKSKKSASFKPGSLFVLFFRYENISSNSNFNSKSWPNSNSNLKFSPNSNSKSHSNANSKYYLNAKSSSKSNSNPNSKEVTSRSQNRNPNSNSISKLGLCKRVCGRSLHFSCAYHLEVPHFYEPRKCLRTSCPPVYIVLVALVEYRKNYFTFAF